MNIIAKQSITLHIHSQIFNIDSNEQLNNEPYISELSYPATLFIKNNEYIITYNEENDKVSLRTKILIQKDTFTIKKIGAFSSVFKLKCNELTKATYNTAAGTLVLELRLLNKTIKPILPLALKYYIMQNNKIVSKNIITLTIVNVAPTPKIDDSLSTLPFHL